MAYNVSLQTATETVSETTFTSLKAAKTFIRKSICAGLVGVISDSEFMSRHIKFNGKNWTGNAPEAWFKA